MLRRAAPTQAAEAQPVRLISNRSSENRHFLPLSEANKPPFSDDRLAGNRYLEPLRPRCVAWRGDRSGGRVRGDLSGAVFWGADLSGARFRDVNLTDVAISHAWLVDVEIDAFIDRFVVNGVDVTAYVNEHDRWYPLRQVVRVSDLESMRAGWVALRDTWAVTVERARLKRPRFDAASF